MIRFERPRMSLRPRPRLSLDVEILAKSKPMVVFEPWRDKEGKVKIEPFSIISWSSSSHKRYKVKGRVQA